MMLVFGWMWLVPFVRSLGSRAAVRNFAVQRGWKWDDITGIITGGEDAISWHVQIVVEFTTVKIEWKCQHKIPFDANLTIEHRGLKQAIFSNPLLWRGACWMLHRELKSDEQDDFAASDAMLEVMRALMRSAPLPRGVLPREGRDWGFGDSFHAPWVRKHLLDGASGERLGVLWQLLSSAERRSFRCELSGEAVTICLECAPHQTATVLETVVELGESLVQRAGELEEYDEEKFFNVQLLHDATRRLTPSERDELRRQMGADEGTPDWILGALKE